MKKKIITAALILMLGAATMTFVGTTLAEAASCGSASECINQGMTASGTSSTPIGWAFWLLIMISVIMVVIGGFKYVTSQGNQQQLKSAKDTILYAIVGLVVAISARAIVQLVVDSLYG